MKKQKIIVGITGASGSVYAKVLLEKLSSKYPLAIVTGRPREEAKDFLQKFEIEYDPKYLFEWIEN